MAETDETYLVAAATTARLANATTAVEVAVTKAWVDAWDALAPALRASYLDILSRYAAGEVIPRSVVAKDARLRAALRQVRATLTALAEHSSTTAGTHAHAVVVATPPEVEAVLRTQLPPPGPGIPDVTVSHPAPDALDAIINRVQDRIHAKTTPLAPDTEAAMRRELVRNLAVGDSPRTTADRIMSATQGRFEGGLGRALNVARTEVLDAYRAASQATSQAAVEVVKAQRWIAKLDAKTCPSCISQHGELFPPDELGPDDHPSGRCTFVPVMKSWKELGIDGVTEPDPVFPDRDAWWDSLTEGTKRNILGPGRYELFKSGQISWADLSVKRTADGWRDYRVAPSLASLTASAT